MFKFCNLFSGSSGNCSFIETENEKILVDCGVSSKKINEALVSINTKLEDISAILLTHEHVDHTKALSIICKKYNIPIYANEKTFNNINQEIVDSSKHVFNTDENFEIGDLKVFPFSIPHDAADPCGFNVSYNNLKVTVATDIGHITNSVFDKLVGSNFVLLESNYEPEMLKCSKYPYMLKKRILGPNGHLSNEDASHVVSHLIKNGSNNIMLGHLSQQNNFPELAYQTVMEEIISCGLNTHNLKLSVADRLKPNKLYEIE